MLTEKQKKEKENKRTRLWRQTNKQKYLKSVCLSTIKNGLKNKIITIKDIQNIIKTMKNVIK